MTIFQVQSLSCRSRWSERANSYPWYFTDFFFFPPDLTSVGVHRFTLILGIFLQQFRTRLAFNQLWHVSKCEIQKKSNPWILFLTAAAFAGNQMLGQPTIYNNVWQLPHNTLHFRCFNFTCFTWLGCQQSVTMSDSCLTLYTFTPDLKHGSATTQSSSVQCVMPRVSKWSLPL